MRTKDMLSITSAYKSIYENDDAAEYDQEGDMAKNQIRQICKANEDLMNMIKDDDNLPEWVQSKITKAQDYMTSVRDYMEAEKAEAAEEDNAEV